MQISVTAPTFSSDPRDTARLSRDAGFTGLLFDAYSKALSLPDLSVTGRREFRHVLSAQEMLLVGLQGDLGAKGLGPGADIDRLIDRIDGALEAASGLAAPLLCLDVGPLAEPPRTEKPKPAISPEQAGLLILPTPVSEPAPALPSREIPIDQRLMDSVHTALVELGVRADRYSVTVAFRSTLASFAALEHAILTARCPWFGVDLDPVAMLNDDWAADEIFSRFGPLIRHVRGRDALAGADRRTKPMPIGQGSTDWPALLSRLDQSDYRSWITVDPTELQDRPAAARAGLVKLHR